MADPKYRQIADSLRLRIESGELPPASQLPTESELSQEFNASRNTIRDAIKSLISLGLVETRPGQGTFVSERPDPLVTILTADEVTGLGGSEGAAYRSEVSEAHRVGSASIPVVRLQQAAGEIAARLQVQEGTRLISRHQERFIEGTPWSLQTSFYPRQFALRGADRLLDDQDIAEGTVRYLEDTLQVKQVGYRDWITVRTPAPDEIAFFRLPPDGRVQIFEIFRTAFDQNGDPMRVTVTVFPTDRNQFIVNVGDIPPATYQVIPADGSYRL
jgi:GntR family transcriptional regulator